MEAEHYAYVAAQLVGNLNETNGHTIWDMNNWVTYSILILFDINTLIIHNTRGMFL